MVPASWPRPGSPGPPGLAGDVLSVGVDDQHHDAPVAFGRVGDLDVEDVDAQPPEQGADLGDHPGAVGHGQPQLAGLAKRGGTCRQVDPRLAGALE